MVSIDDLNKKKISVETEYQSNMKYADPAPNTYEMALVFGGTVSAAAYSAGVVDFLIEALDCWAEEKKKNAQNTPQHKVCIKVLAGASGGGVTAAALARCLPYSFPHVSLGANQEVPDNADQNPFFSLWVNRLDLAGRDDLAGLCDTGDLPEDEAVTGLLSSIPLDAAATWLAKYANTPGLKNYEPRSQFFADPLEVILTYTNVHGIPYGVAYDAGWHFSVDTADHVRFSIGWDHNVGRRLTRPCSGDAIQVLDNPGPFSDPVGDFQINWNTFTEFAKGTGALPGGLKARKLQRPAYHYLYRPVVLPPQEPDIPAVVKVRMPVWEKFLDSTQTGFSDTYELLAVDGGGTDNQPVELARVALAGVGGRNKRDKSAANRGVILIDPFDDQPDCDDHDELLSYSEKTGRKIPADLRKSDAIIHVIPNTLSALLNRARFSTSDTLLAADGDVFSRFRILPVRPVDINNPVGETIVGAKAAATTGASGFVGFLDKELRVHDFFLGRYNCQQFLKYEFCLAKDNPVFIDGLSQSDDRSELLRIIPLFGNAAVTQTIPEWPRNKVNWNKVESALKRRINLAVDRLHDDFSHKSDFGLGSLFSPNKVWNEVQSRGEDVLLFGIKTLLKNKIRKALIKLLLKNIEKWDLSQPNP